MRFFRRAPTARTGIQPAPKMVMRTSNRPGGGDRPRLDRPRATRMRKVGPLCYPERPVDLARDPRFADTLTAHAVRMQNAEDVKFLAQSGPPYTFTKFLLLYDNHINPHGLLPINLPKDLSKSANEFVSNVRACESRPEEWTTFILRCVEVIDDLVADKWRNPCLDFFESAEFETLHQARLQMLQRRRR